MKRLFWLMGIFIVLLLVVFMASAQPEIITDYIAPQPRSVIPTSVVTMPPDFVMHTAQPGVTPYPPNPTFIPFLAVPTLERPNYRATLIANGWVFPDHASP